MNPLTHSCRTMHSLVPEASQRTGLPYTLSSLCTLGAMSP